MSVFCNVSVPLGLFQIPSLQRLVWVNNSTADFAVDTLYVPRPREFWNCGALKEVIL